jgi:hypothetical protein
LHVAEKLDVHRILASLLFLAAAAAAPGAEAVSFSSDIRPLFEKQCWTCHSSTQKLSDLDLTSRESALKGGVHGPAIVPGKPDESRLMMHVTGKEAPRMPLGAPLPDESVALLRTWIEQGAPYEAVAVQAPAAKRSISDEDRKWWAFQKPTLAPPPTPSDTAWRANPIDAYVFDKLASKGLKPAPRADKRTLIRRAYLDLVGLLPPTDEVERFVADDSPDAWPKLIEKLLDSPNYGERWGRHWLDVVRYADSSGYEHDFDYPNAWRFRDYVIQSFNADKPYDRFVREQLAGDELGDWSYETLIATGFYRIGARVLFREKDNPEYRYNYLDDMIQTTSRAFLGLSVECARCHDHKFDPILQKDYYRMMAIFFPHIRYDFPLAPPEVIAAHDKQVDEIEGRIQPLKAEIGRIEKPYRAIKKAEKIKEFPQEIQDAVNTPEDQRTDGQKLLAEQVLTIGGGDIDDIVSGEDRARLKELKGRIKALEAQMPPELPLAMGIRDGDYRSAPDGAGDEVQPGKGQREVYENVGPFIPARGKPYAPPVARLLPNADYHDKGDVVEPGVLTVLARPEAYAPEAPDNGRVSTGRRLALANWIVSGDHPLTSRVMANRIWQGHFGQGIVGTPSNFGKMGQAATHPELLDYLAIEFVKRGWSVKAMHRLIMSSQTYQMASAYGNEAAQKADPNDKLLWRYPARRLESEILRDVTLDAAGKLNFAAGGEPFFPPIPQSVRDSFLQGRWEMTEPGPPVWRRSVYTYHKRGLRYPMFEVFDQPSMNVTCERRNTTTVPTQALTLLNNSFLLEQAAAFADRVWATAGSAPEKEIHAAYEIALGRPAKATELEANRAFLARQKDYHSRERDPAKAALVDLCDVVLNLNEFVYLP